MPKIDWDYYREIKERVKEEDSPEVRRLGYHVACGFGKLEEAVSIELRLSPLNESADPINKDLLEKIKTDLMDKYNVPFNVHYVPRIVKRKE